MVKTKLPKAAISWSTGKDSSMALYQVLKSRRFDPVMLLTTVTHEYNRVSMHGVREELLRRQAEACGIPMLKVEITSKSTNEAYEKSMQMAIDKLRNEGVEYMVFGDIFLEDVRDYRIKMMKDTGIEPVFPLWGMNTSRLAYNIIDVGIQARVACLDPNKVDTALGGDNFDREFLKSLSDGVDPCGENGEFHTFVYNAPFFQSPINVKKGESVLREGFYFTDIIPQ